MPDAPSRPETQGIESVSVADSSVAGEVAEAVTGNLVDGSVNSSVKEKIGEGLKAQMKELNAEAQVEQLQAELKKTKEMKDKISKEKDALESSLKKANEDLQNAKRNLDQSQSFTGDRDVQSQVQNLTADLNNHKSALAEANKKIEQCADIPDALAAANEQVAALNTQIAHLYASLTYARTELEQARAGQMISKGDEMTGGIEEARQNSQIADLVSDIRHLQLDLEYHQQKLDQLIDEKQMMMQQMKKSQDELAFAKKQLQERDQLLKHKEIDLQRALTEAKSSNSKEAGAKLEDQIEALKKEAAAKDSALIVSHYELHKEKLMRDRLEQKNLKLMERLQKLMMVVETQRKENFGLEKQLQAHETLVQDKDQQLREVTHKAKQLQKAFKVQSSRVEKKTPRGDISISPKQNSASLNTDAFVSQGLPPLQ